MSGSIKRIATYLKALPSGEYNLPSQVTNTVNYLLDCYFAKVDERNTHTLPDKFIPSSPQIHIQELWLGCDFHKAISLNCKLPTYAKNLHAWAFHCLFEQYGYKITPFVDQYEFKDAVKDSYGFQIQSEQLSLALDQVCTLPIFGYFFVCTSDGINLVVNIDFGYNMGCGFSVLAAPEHKQAAENFIRDFKASSIKNDIYLNKCLSFNRGTLEFMDIIPTIWNDIVLKQDVIDSIKNNSVSILHNMDKLATVGMCPNRNTILISPPGMAKTTVFRAISNEIQDCSTRIWCTGKSIEGPEHVTALFEAARGLAPCIIFMEDVDLIGRNRDRLSGTESHTLNEFLACLDGASSNAGVVVMASTNDIKAMDEALVNRPGRFDVKIEMPYPDLEDRKLMLYNFLKCFNAIPNDSVTPDTLKSVLELCDGLTGAYIKELAKIVVIRAVADGRIDNGQVVFTADDLTTAGQQVINSFTVGQKAKTTTIKVDAN